MEARRILKTKNPYLFMMPNGVVVDVRDKIPPALSASFWGSLVILCVVVAMA